MKKAFYVSLIIFSAFFILATAIFIYGFHMANKGEEDTRWLIHEMWGGDFFEEKNNATRPEDAMLIKSLSVGFPSRDEVDRYLEKNICKDNTRECREYILIAANAQAGVNGIDEARKLLALAAVRAKEASAGECPIRFELAYLNLVRHGLQKERKNKNYNGMIIKAVNKIKEDGGFLYNLRSVECVYESKVAPEIFRSYVSLIEKIMAGGGHGMKWSAAVIRRKLNNKD